MSRLTGLMFSIKRAVTYLNSAGSSLPECYYAALTEGQLVLSGLSCQVDSSVKLSDRVVDFELCLGVRLSILTAFVDIFWVGCVDVSKCMHQELGSCYGYVSSLNYCQPANNCHCWCIHWLRHSCDVVSTSFSKTSPLISVTEYNCNPAHIENLYGSFNYLLQIMI